MAENHHVSKVTFNDRGYFVTAPLYQYDYGQILQFDGFDLPDAFEVHFSSPEDAGKSVTQIGTTTDGVSTVAIPDACLLKSKTITAWLYLHDEVTDGETRFVVEILVRHRAEITEDTPTPVEQSAIDQAIAALNSAVEKVEESVVSADAAIAAAEAAQTSATAAASSATDAETSRQFADQDATTAVTAKNVALAAQTAAETAQAAAEAAADHAEETAESIVPATVAEVVSYLEIE